MRVLAKRSLFGLAFVLNYHLHRMGSKCLRWTILLYMIFFCVFNFFDAWYVKLLLLPFPW